MSEISPEIAEAGCCLNSQLSNPSPVIPTLRRRFGLTASQAVEAIRAADQFRSEKN